MKKLIATYVALCLLITFQVANADLVVTVGPAQDAPTQPVAGGIDVDLPVLAEAGNMGVIVPVFLHENAGVSIELSSFTLPYDFAGSGSLTSAPFENIGFSSLATGLSAGQFTTFNPTDDTPFDVAFSASGNALPISTDATNPTLLFNFTFDIASSAIPGLYSIDFSDFAEAGDEFLVLNGPNGGPVPVNVVFDNGQVLIAAIPEPNAVALLILVGGIIGTNRRRG